MRLWHYELLSVLPRCQLVSQLRECTAIAKNIHKYGTPNHLLVNKISDYDIRDFNIYCNKVIYYMLQRGYNVSESTLDKLEEYTNFRLVGSPSLEYSIVFKDWHNKEYLRICMANLYEKHISQGESQITDEEWQKIIDKYKKITKEEYKV